MCVPAREEAATIAGVVGPLMALREAGVVDQVLVLDDDSRDGTGAIAAALGAEVVRPAALLPAFGPVLGKGDAMWRALSAVASDVVVLRRRRLRGLRRPLRDRPARPAGLRRRACSSSRASIAGRSRAARAGRSDRRRPRHRADGAAAAGGVLSRAGRRPPAAGGRVRRAPRPARADGVLHRLRGRDRAAARRRRGTPGVEAIAQVDLDVRQNRHQPLADLAPMAAAVLAAVTCRLRREGRLDADRCRGGRTARAPAARRAARAARPSLNEAPRSGASLRRAPPPPAPSLRAASGPRPGAMTKRKGLPSRDRRTARHANDVAGSEGWSRWPSRDDKTEHRALKQADRDRCGARGRDVHAPRGGPCSRRRSAAGATDAEEPSLTARPRGSSSSATRPRRA